LKLENHCMIYTLFVCHTYVCMHVHILTCMCVCVCITHPAGVRVQRVQGECKRAAAVPNGPCAKGDSAQRHGLFARGYQIDAIRLYAIHLDAIHLYATYLCAIHLYARHPPLPASHKSVQSVCCVVFVCVHSVFVCVHRVFVCVHRVFVCVHSVFVCVHSVFVCVHSVCSVALWSWCTTT